MCLPARIEAMTTDQRAYTATEFEQFTNSPENADRLLELINGEIVEKVPTEEHGIIVLRIGSRVMIFVETRQLGHVGVEIRHRLPEDEENVRLPDVSFRKTQQAPVKKGSVPQMPDLAVEVKSPTNTIRELREKADYYLANGSQMVWLVYPTKRLVEVYTTAEELILTEDDVIDGGDVLPEFTLPVREIFNPHTSSEA